MLGVFKVMPTDYTGVYKDYYDNPTYYSNGLVHRIDGPAKKTIHSVCWCYNDYLCQPTEWYDVLTKEEKDNFLNLVKGPKSKVPKDLSVFEPKFPNVIPDYLKIFKHINETELLKKYGMVYYHDCDWARAYVILSFIDHLNHKELSLLKASKFFPEYKKGKMDLISFKKIISRVKKEGQEFYLNFCEDVLGDLNKKDLGDTWGVWHYHIAHRFKFTSGLRVILENLELTYAIEYFKEKDYLKLFKKYQSILNGKDFGILIANIYNKHKDQKEIKNAIKDIVSNEKRFVVLAAFIGVLDKTEVVWFLDSKSKLVLRAISKRLDKKNVC